MIRPMLQALAALLVAAPAFAFNHETVVPPITVGPFNVACSNIGQDTSRMVAGSVPSDYWEGRLVNDQPLYITQILSAPQTAIVFDAIPPDNREIYPNTANTRVPFVAIVCHPTPRANGDPGYVLPGTNDIVPHMQAAGAAPKLLSADEYALTVGAAPPQVNGPQPLPYVVYSHGLGGSPIGAGYIDSMVALASNGYVVAAVFHADNRFSRVRVNDLGDFWYLLTQYDRVAEMMLMRPVALKTMTDVLLAHPQFAPAIDASRIAGFGASLGGQAIANLMGAKLTTTISLACRETVRDPRIKVGVGYVPYSGQTFLPAFCDGQSGADEMSRPYLAIAGTADTTAPLRMTRQAVSRFRGSRYLVELVDGEHELRPEDIGDLFTWMVTFYRAYLEQQPGAYGKLFAMHGVTGGREDHLTIDVHLPTTFQPGQVPVVELHNDILDRYFLETDPADVSSMVNGSAGPGWTTTGYVFKAWSQLPASLFTCHYDTTVMVGSEVSRQCDFARRLGRWTYDDGGGFFIEKTDTNGRCPAGELILNRLYTPRLALSRLVSSQRYVTSDSAAKAMMGAGWVLLPPTMCARY